MVISSVIERLKTLGYEVYDTYLADDVEPTYPYLLVWETAPTPRVERPTLSGGSRQYQSLIGVMSVGLTAKSVRTVATKVRGLLDDWAPGMANSVFWDDSQHMPAYSRPIVRDKDTPLIDGNAVLWGSDFYQFTGQK